MISNDFNKIQNHISLVTNDMLERYPNCHYTIKILLWDDGTSSVECRHARNVGKEIIICNSLYYEDELKYNEYPLVSNKIRIDGRGNEYNVK